MSRKPEASEVDFFMPTEGDVLTRIAAIDVELASAKGAADAARLRAKALHGLRIVGHSDASRFDGAEEELATAAHRAEHLQRDRDALAIAAGYCAQVSARRRLAELAPKYDAANGDLREYDDVEQEDLRREAVRLRRIGIETNVSATALLPSPAEQREYPRRKAARLIAQARLATIGHEIEGVNSVLATLNARYGDLSALFENNPGTHRGESNIG